MPAPKFVTCQICGRGFGSASINIHTPQCYEKALKRWQLNPSGPKPVMPPPHGKSSGDRTIKGGGRDGGDAVGGLDSVPVGKGSAAAKSLATSGGGPQPPMDASGPANPNLHPCRKCGRKFNFDRIGYHESVCKGDTRRPVFNSTKQRMPNDADADDFSYSTASTTRNGKRGAASSRPIPRNPRRPPPSTWRQQHEEFIAAVRSAREAEAREVRAVPRGPTGPTSTSTGARAGAGGLRVNQPRTAPAVAPSQRRVPALMVMQDESRKANMTTGGRAAKAQARSSISTPALRKAPVRKAVAAKSTAPSGSRGAFGGTSDRFAGYGPGGASAAAGGGGGGYRIANDNSTSLGMKQAFGQA